MGATDSDKREDNGNVVLNRSRFFAQNNETLTDSFQKPKLKCGRNSHLAEIKLFLPKCLPKHQYFGHCHMAYYRGTRDYKPMISPASMASAGYY